MAAVTLLDLWAQQACSYVDRLPETLMELMALAQHHGLATPLLDWTLNPLVALFFAANQHPTRDGVVYVLRPLGEIHADSTRGVFGCGKGFAGYRPRNISPRILNQRGVFTFHSEPNVALTAQAIAAESEALSQSFQCGKKACHACLHAIPVISSYKKSFLLALDSFGINEQSLFPSLDGLSKHVNWWKLEKCCAKHISDEQINAMMEKCNRITSRA